MKQLNPPARAAVGRGGVVVGVSARKRVHLQSLIRYFLDVSSSIKTLNQAVNALVSIAGVQVDGESIGGGYLPRLVVFRRSGG